LGCWFGFYELLDAPRKLFTYQTLNRLADNLLEEHEGIEGNCG